MGQIKINTTTTMDTKKTETNNIHHPNNLQTVNTSSQETITTGMVDNRWQKLGEVQTFDKETTDELKAKMTEALTDNSDKEISLIWYSDANNFVWSEEPNSQSQRLIVNHKRLMDRLWNDLSEQQKSTLTMPAMPDKTDTKAMSDWLNTVLAQARALKGLETWKSLLPPEDFTKFINKVSIGIAPKQPTYAGEDRWVKLLFSDKKTTEDIITIETPKTKIDIIEKEKKRYKVYQPITFTYEDGKVYTAIWETDIQKTNTKVWGVVTDNHIEVKAKRQPSGQPRGYTPINVWYPTKQSEKYKYSTTEDKINHATKSDPPRYGTYNKETTSTTTGIDKTTNQPKTIISKTEEVTPLAWDVIVLPPISYGSLGVTDAKAKSKKDGNLTPPIRRDDGTTKDWDQPYVNNAAIDPVLNKQMPIDDPVKLKKLFPNNPSYSSSL